MAQRLQDSQPERKRRHGKGQDVSWPPFRLRVPGPPEHRGAATKAQQVPIVRPDWVPLATLRKKPPASRAGGVAVN